LRNKSRIDATDTKILKILLKDSRTSFTKMSKDCKITVGAVRMRYQRLWKAGIINGEIMLVNPHILGYKYIIDLGITTALENEKEVMEFLGKKPYIRHIVGPFGKYNFWAKVALQDVKKLAEILQDLESNSFIERVDSFIWAEAINIEYPEKLVIKPINDTISECFNQRSSSGNLEETKFDETDRKIATMLSQNARMPFRKIAAELGISTKNVIQRYRKMKGNVLTLSTITVDLDKLGYKSFAHMFMKVANRSKIPEICAQMLQIPNLVVMIRLIGVYDLYVCIALADFEELFTVTEQIRRIQGIDRTETILTPPPRAWPLQLFPSLLQSELMEPKSWLENSADDWKIL
jgi:Lrp/AsnC family transcriptional regulator, regulator for asnA, asnC and gidA